MIHHLTLEQKEKLHFLLINLSFISFFLFDQKVHQIINEYKIKKKYICIETLKSWKINGSEKYKKPIKIMNSNNCQ